MIKISNLNKVYKFRDNSVHALKDVSIEISQGDAYGIIGLSGAGKSSLVRCINRLEESTSGSIEINGVDILSLTPKALRKARHKIGMIFQNFSLFNSKTVYENVAFPLRIQKLTEKEIEKRVTDLLEKVELLDKAHTYPSMLSGGQKQRVGIARALANDPEVLLCDEATSALDPKTTKGILELLSKINSELGLTLIVITHEMDVIKTLCNKVTILQDGEVIVSGNTLDLFTQKTDANTEHFLSNFELPTTLPTSGYNLLITFSGKVASEPLLSKLIRLHNIDINILSGNIEEIGKTAVGKLLVSVDCTKQTLDAVLNYLTINNAQVEVI